MQVETSYPAIIGRILEHLRKESKMDQKEFSKKIGLTQSAWSRIERGQSGISMEQLRKISKILVTQPHMIISDADDVADKLKSDGVIVHDSVITKQDNIIAFLGLAALGLMVVAILSKK